MGFVLVDSPPIANREVCLSNLHSCIFTYQFNIQATGWLRQSNNFCQHQAIRITAINLIIYPHNTWTEMCAARIACCPLVSHVEYALTG